MSKSSPTDYGEELFGSTTDSGEELFGSTTAPTVSVGSTVLAMSAESPPQAAAITATVATVVRNLTMDRITAW